ncbi:MAG: RsmB/NOP family class I SAM-dependent RNA methyltransferase, partial [Promethearchaeota archaeon]
NLRKNPIIFHYYTEIIRFWSKLNFILQKTSRSLNNFSVSNKDTALYLFLIYRSFFEGASNNEIISELNLSKNKIRTYIQFLDQLKTFSWEIALAGKSNRERISIKEAIPNFFIDRLLPVMDLQFLKENIQYLNYSNLSHNFFRFNELKRVHLINHSFNEIKKSLEEEGVSLKRDQEFSDLFMIQDSQKSKLLTNKWYQSGYLILQDKASVTVVHVLNPQPDELILDICAAPGNKTSLIAQKSKNKAKIIANDFNKDRISFAKKLLLKMNASCSSLTCSDGITPPYRDGIKFDKVLLDAPCTGSGAFLTSPELKWRQNRSFLYQNMTLQEKLFQSSIHLLKPEGTLVYSTCSLYPEEGELQVLKFLNELEPLDLPNWVSPSYKIDDKQVPGSGRLFPSIHHSQGFFIGIFKKKE